MEEVLEEFMELIDDILRRLDQLSREVGRIEKDLIKLSIRIKKVEQQLGMNDPFEKDKY